MTARKAAAAAVLLVATCLATLSITASTVPARHYIGHHWAHNGLKNSQIYFVDRTGDKWPVELATYRWNRARNVDSFYQTSCPNRRLHCVDVDEYRTDDGNYGVTYFNGWNRRNHNRRGVRVRLNNATVRTARQARKTTCHELGHVLGLDHRSTNESCMRQGSAPPISRYPDRHDLRQLRAMYRHRN